jgi:histidine phosphotransfer protein HptB
MTQLFDEAVFRLFAAELGDAEAVEVLQVFLADTADKMVRIAASGETRPLIKLEAHSIKSSAATFGFADLSRRARELEFGAETIAPAKLRESVCELQQSFDKARQFAQTNLLNKTLEPAS